MRFFHFFNSSSILDTFLSMLIKYPIIPKNTTHKTATTTYILPSARIPLASYTPVSRAKLLLNVCKKITVNNKRFFFKNLVNILVLF